MNSLRKAKSRLCEIIILSIATFFLLKRQDDE